MWIFYKHLIYNVEEQRFYFTVPWSAGNRQFIYWVPQACGTSGVKNRYRNKGSLLQTSP